MTNDDNYQAPILWKTLAFYIVFMLMYAAYRFFPVFPLDLFCGVCESNFQHYKAGFFAYLIVNLFEYIIVRNRIQNWDGFVYSRMLATVFLPWIMFLLWYTGPAIFGRLPNIPLEILYANLITLVVGVATVILERSYESATPSGSAWVVVIALFVISIGLFIVFTYRLPWADVFVEPDWR
jgi:hypothetical protein